MSDNTVTDPAPDAAADMTTASQVETPETGATLPEGPAPAGAVVTEIPDGEHPARIGAFGVELPPYDVTTEVGLHFKKGKHLYIPGLPMRDLTVGEVTTWVGSADALNEILRGGVYSRTDFTPTLPAAIQPKDAD